MRTKSIFLLSVLVLNASIALAGKPRPTITRLQDKLEVRMFNETNRAFECRGRLRVKDEDNNIVLDLELKELVHVFHEKIINIPMPESIVVKDIFPQVYCLNPIED